MDLTFSYFFDLSRFPYTDLFKAMDQPWLALSQIEVFLKHYPLGQIKGTISPQAYLIDPHLISIGEGSVVEPGAYIRGPCLLGKNCVVRHGAYIRGNFVAGDDCVIGHDTEIKNSIFLQHALAGHFAYIGDSILGNDVNLGAGVKCANLKLDHDKVNVHFENQRFITSLKKLGAIIGDRTQIGCNTVTNPGTLLGKEVLCYPSLNVGGFIPSRSVIKSETKLVIRSY